MLSHRNKNKSSFNYSIGGIQNVDIDRVLLRDDMSEDYFKTDSASGNVVLDIEQLLVKHKVVQSLTDQRRLNPEELLSKADLDEKVFSMGEADGLISIDINNLIQEYNLVQTTSKINQLNVDSVLMRDDIPPYILGSTGSNLENLGVLDAQFNDGALIVNSTAAKTYAALLNKKKPVVPQKPITLIIYDDCDMNVLSAIAVQLSGQVVLDISNYSQDLTLFDALNLNYVNSRAVVSSTS